MLARECRLRLRISQSRTASSNISPKEGKIWGPLSSLWDYRGIFRKLLGRWESIHVMLYVSEAGRELATDTCFSYREFVRLNRLPGERAQPDVFIAP
jgi:hypothetical protein